MVSFFGILRLMYYNLYAFVTVFHASELPLLFGMAPASELSLSEAFTDAYINFVTDLDPGCE